MAGFSHRSQPEQVRVTWYPFQEWRVRVYFYARNRRDASKQLRNVCGVRDLDDGKRGHWIPATIAVRLYPELVPPNPS